MTLKTHVVSCWWFNEFVLPTVRQKLISIQEVVGRSQMLCCIIVVVRMQSASWRLCWTWRTAVLSCHSCLFLLCSTFLRKEEQRCLKGFSSLGMWRWVIGLVLPGVSKERIDCMDCSVRQNIGIRFPPTQPHIRTPESSATPRSRIGLQVYLAACARTCVSLIDSSYSHLFFTNLGINTCHWNTLEHCTCSSEISPTRCNNCVFILRIQQAARHRTRQWLPTTPQR